MFFKPRNENVWENLFNLLWKRDEKLSNNLLTRAQELLQYLPSSLTKDIFLERYIPLFNNLWHPMSPSDVRIVLSFFIKVDYLSNDTKIFVFWRKTSFNISSWSREPLTSRKKVSVHLESTKNQNPLRKQILTKC